MSNMSVPALPRIYLTKHQVRSRERFGIPETHGILSRIYDEASGPGTASFGDVRIDET